MNQKVQLQIVGGGVQQYLSGISSSNGISISIDPKLNFTVNDSFADVTASNILLFLAQKYKLDISILGSIIYVTTYQEPVVFVKVPVKEINAKYNAADNLLSLSLDNDTLTAVAKKITQLSGKNIIVQNGLQGKRVSGFIANAPFETAMDKLAFANEIKVIRTNDNFYVFQPLSDNEELYVNGDKSTAVRKTFRPATTGGSTGSTQVFSKMVGGQKMISADAVSAPIVNLVKQASQELNKNYSIYSELKGTIDIHVSDITYDDFLGLIFRGTNYTFQSENGVYLIGDKTIEGLRTHKEVHLQNRSLDTIMAMIPAEWKKGLEIKEFREQNTILLSGSIAQINEAANFIKSLDVLVPVVLIEVTMIDFHKSRTVATGITAGVSDSVKTGGSVLPGINFTFSATSVNSFLSSISKFTSINLGHVVPNFYVGLQALENNNNVDIRSIPKLTALNGHPAKLSIGSKLYYKNTTQNLYPSASTSTSVFTNTYTSVDADLSIDIKPVVSGDDQVTLNIKVNVSDFTAIPTDGSPPPQSISQFESTLRVHDGDTLLLGGIERTENDLTTSGTPILSRIPILKWIFSSRTKTASKVTTVLFIKSTILR
ncbi:type II secretion system protein GspD [Mucilaginibacter sp. McL0603]|uniref:type II secretion system protein GspD n=1 Tax=Mucilaginibacter sp. McL0603 TaxID=3415670 RepID=UPI003CE90495